MARARVASPTGVFCRRSQPSNVARVASSISTFNWDGRPRIALSFPTLVAGVWHAGAHLNNFVPHLGGAVLRDEPNAKRRPPDANRAGAAARGAWLDRGI